MLMTHAYLSVEKNSDYRIGTLKDDVENLIKFFGSHKHWQDKLHGHPKKKPKHRSGKVNTKFL